MTSTVVARAKQVQETLTVQTSAGAQRVAATLEQFVPLVEQVISQTTRRVLQGDQGPASDKIVSLFEPERPVTCSAAIYNAKRKFHKQDVVIG